MSPPSRAAVAFAGESANAMIERGRHLVTVSG